MDLVVGGNGFLGRALVTKLLSDGKLVRVLDKKQGENLANLENVLADINDHKAVSEAVKGCDTVYNLASLLPCSRAGNDFIKVNVQGTKNVLSACKKQKVKKVVHVSSSIVYGIPGNNPIVETDPTLPIGDYGRSKLAAENVCLEYIDNGLNISILRPRFIVGPGRLGLLTILFDWIKEDRNIYSIGDGKNKFQMVGTDDLVSACIGAAKYGKPEKYNIGADIVPSVEDLLNGLVGHAKSGSRLVKTPAGAVKVLLGFLNLFRLTPLGLEHYLIADRDYILDTTKAKRDLSWQPIQNPQLMINSAYDWYLANKKSLDKTNKSNFPSLLLLKILKKIS